MTEIYRDGQTVIRCEHARIVIEQAGTVTAIEASELQTVAELTPCVTFGKFTDFHTIAIQKTNGHTIYVPTNKAAAKKLLASIQQFRLDCARQQAAQ